jgi:hypothetical protein
MSYNFQNYHHKYHPFLAIASLKTRVIKDIKLEIFKFLKFLKIEVNFEAKFW